MLKARQHSILIALINDYIFTASPVSSKVIMDKYVRGISSATIRNELSHLEDLGYIMSPHVSSGRVPTDLGYRYYVDSLLLNDEEARTCAKLLSEEMMGRYTSPELDIEDIHNLTSLGFENLANTLNVLTNCLAVVLAPRINSMTLLRVTLVLLDSHHISLIMVAKDGTVTSHIVETPFEESHSSFRKSP